MYINRNLVVISPRALIMGNGQSDRPLVRIQLNLKDCFVSNCCGKAKEEEKEEGCDGGGPASPALINSHIDVSSESCAGATIPCSLAAAVASKRRQQTVSPKQRNTLSL